MRSSTSQRTIFVRSPSGCWLPWQYFEHSPGRIIDIFATAVRRSPFHHPPPKQRSGQRTFCMPCWWLLRCRKPLYALTALVIAILANKQSGPDQAAPGEVTAPPTSATRKERFFHFSRALCREISKEMAVTITPKNLFLALLSALLCRQTDPLSVAILRQIGALIHYAPREQHALLAYSLLGGVMDALSPSAVARLEPAASNRHRLPNSSA